MQNSTGSSTITATVQPQIIKESRIQPFWHVIVLNVLTVGFYAPVWFFKTARGLVRRLEIGQGKVPAPTSGTVGGQEGHVLRTTDTVALKPLTTSETNSLDLIKRVPPIFLMLGMLLPFINFLLGAYFFRMIADLYPQQSTPVRKHPIVTGLLLSAMLVGGLCLSKLPSFYYLSYCLGVAMPLATAQHLLNAYWRSIELDDDLLVRHSFSTTELLMLIAGILLLGFIIASYCIVPFDIHH